MHMIDQNRHAGRNESHQHSHVAVGDQVTSYLTRLWDHGALGVRQGLAGHAAYIRNYEIGYFV